MCTLKLQNTNIFLHIFNLRNFISIGIVRANNLICFQLMLCRQVRTCSIYEFNYILLVIPAINFSILWNTLKSLHMPRSLEQQVALILLFYCCVAFKKCSQGLYLLHGVLVGSRTMVRIKTILRSLPVYLCKWLRVCVMIETYLY